MKPFHWFLIVTDHGRHFEPIKQQWKLKGYKFWVKTFSSLICLFGNKFYELFAICSASLSICYCFVTKRWLDGIHSKCFSPHLKAHFKIQSLALLKLPRCPRVLSLFRPRCHIFPLFHPKSHWGKKLKQKQRKFFGPVLASVWSKRYFCIMLQDNIVHRWGKFIGLNSKQNLCMYRLNQAY